MSTILDKYNIRFINKVYLGRVYKLTEPLLSVSYTLSGFISEFRNLSDLELCVSLFLYFENGGIYDFEKEKVSTETFCAYIFEPEVLIFCLVGEDDSDFTMPREELLEILILWKQFLLTPPLNGTTDSGSEDNFIV